MTPSEANPPTLRVHDAGKRFGHTVALDRVSLQLEGSEILALVGPSGCGKTTLLRSIGGLAGLDSGSIHIDGEIVDDSRHVVPPEKRRVGLVFQDHSLFPHLSVIDNVSFGIRDAARRDVRARAIEALDLVRLSGFADRYPHELSGGERQRVALARALAPRPTLMLLDEPFASLDPNLRGGLRRDIIEALRSTRTPAVFVTHDQSDALAIGDRIAIMRAGRIEQVDEPSTVFHQPRSRFVAAFMGEASFLPVERSGDGWATTLGPVASHAADGATPSLAMVRPDDVSFRPDPSGGSCVTRAEFCGTTWNYTIALADGTEIVTARSHLEPLDLGCRGTVELVAGHTQVPIAEES